MSIESKVTEDDKKFGKILLCLICFIIVFLVLLVRFSPGPALQDNRDKEAQALQDFLDGKQVSVANAWWLIGPDPTNISPMAQQCLLSLGRKDDLEAEKLEKILHILYNYDTQFVVYIPKPPIGDIQPSKGEKNQ